MLATNTTTNLNIICAHSCYCPWPDPSHYSKEMDDAQKPFGPMLCTFWACNGQPIVPYKPKTCIKRHKLCVGNANACLSATRHILDKQKGR